MIASRPRSIRSLFAFLAIALLGHARTTRESRWGADPDGIRHRGGLEGCRDYWPTILVTLNALGHTSRVSYSDWGDYNCGL